MVGFPEAATVAAGTETYPLLFGIGETFSSGFLELENRGTVINIQKRRDLGHSPRRSPHHPLIG